MNKKTRVNANCLQNIMLSLTIVLNELFLRYYLLILCFNNLLTVFYLLFDRLKFLNLKYSSTTFCTLVFLNISNINIKCLFSK